MQKGNGTCSCRGASLFSLPPFPSLPLPPSLHLPRLWHRTVSCRRRKKMEHWYTGTPLQTFLPPHPLPLSKPSLPLPPFPVSPDERPPWRETTSLLRPLSKHLCFTFLCKWASIPRTAPPPPPPLKKDQQFKSTFARPFGWSWNWKRASVLKCSWETLPLFLNTDVAFHGVCVEH